MTTETTASGGFIGDPAAAFSPPAAGGCCGGTNAGTDATAATTTCCGTAQAAEEAGSCCDPAAKADAVAKAPDAADERQPPGIGAGRQPRGVHLTRAAARGCLPPRGRRIHGAAYRDGGEPVSCRLARRSPGAGRR